jgi:AcrR family transcriptional regulator
LRQNASESLTRSFYAAFLRNKGEENVALHSKESITGTLIALTAATPLDDVTVQMIVQKCGMNRKTFYYHFRGIRDLICESMTTRLRQALDDAHLQSDAAQTAAQALTVSICAALRFTKENKEILTAVSNSRYRADVIVFLQDALEDKMREYLTIALTDQHTRHGERLLLDEKNKSYIVTFYAAALYSLIEEWLRDGMRESVASFTNTLEKLVGETVASAIAAFALPGA